MSALNLLYVNAPNMGYGRLGVKLAQTLRARGIDIYDHLPTPNGWEPDEHNQDKQAGIANVACWVSTPSHASGWWKGQHPALFTMWEATRLPEGFFEYLHEFETIIVPSPQNVSLFSEHHDNVHLATLGVDPVEWAYRERLPVEDEFRYMVGGSGPRKGTDLVHKAFMTLWGREGSWGSGPTPKLVMKNPRGEAFYGERVQIVSGKLSAEEERDLYAYAHCYVQPSRGEGFGLQPLQAIAQGCPTILTDAHGHESFSHLGYKVGWDYSPADYFIFGNAGDWWEPNFDDLVEQMRWVYEHPEACFDEAKKASEVAHRDFSWDRCADQFLAALPTDLTDYIGPQEWYKPDRKLFRLRVRQGRKMEIGGTKFVMVPGEDYWVPADVKRIVFENDNLDPECVDDDHGLTETQLERFGLNAARLNSCPTCGRSLNE